MDDYLKEVKDLDELLKSAPDEMRLAMLMALLRVPRMDGLTCAIKPQGDFKSLGVRRDNHWFAAISVNQTGLKGYFEPSAKVDTNEIENVFGKPANRKDKVVSIPIRTLDDMLNFLTVLEATV